MTVLKEGCSGNDVKQLQTQLQALSFLSGAIDGVFGNNTKNAVIAFQQSKGLSADGEVGPQTEAALSAASNTASGTPTPSSTSSSTMPAITVDIVCKMFPVTPTAHIQANLPHVLTALEAAKLTSTPIVLAALATIRAETEGFMPISEGISHFNTSPGGHPFDLYDNRHDLGNRGPSDGADFKGRGYVQLTGRTNYTKFGPAVGVPNLDQVPDRANDPDIAAHVLAAFIAAEADKINAALQRNDLAEARRLVNGGSNGLDRFSEAYETGMKLLNVTPA